MAELVEKALSARRESKHIEFKQSFDPHSPREWCELIKDIAAMANSGGGIIVFGLDSAGEPSAASIEAILAVDPADIANKLAKYTGPVDLQFDIRKIKKQGHSLAAFVVEAAAIPLVFTKPGTYDIGSGKQHSAFGMGTVYFRHGAKSEPGTSDDIRRVVERQVEYIRRSWLKGVRKGVQAPSGAEIVTRRLVGSHGEHAALASTVRAVKDPTAIPVRLTRDRSLATGTFVHEEISDALFDEINNVVEANRVLAKGQKHFLLGQPVYYRVYAERHHVQQADEDLALLYTAGVCDFYGPSLFWALALPAELVAEVLTYLFLHPKSPHIHHLIRLGVLLGPDFCKWLFGRWHDKWKRYAQPPAFYWAFKKMIEQTSHANPRLVAARTSLTSQIDLGTEGSVTVKALLDEPERAAGILSRLCVKVFNGSNDLRTVTRALDYLAYGDGVMRRSSQISNAVKASVGTRDAGDPSDTEGVD